MSRRLLRRGLAAAATLATFALPSAALAQDKFDGASPVAEAEEDIAGEAAIFARYADLGTAETEARLAELLKSDERAKLVFTVSDALAREKVSARELEATLLSLLKGLTEEGADRTLAALMLQHYLDYVQGPLATREDTPADAFKTMDAGAEVLLSAAYGPTHPRYRYKKRRI